MKGSVAQCAEELVRTQFGDAKWDEVCVAAGLPAGTRFMPAADLDDAAVLGAFGAIADVTGLTALQVSEAFGHHWVCEYAPRQYPAYFRGLTSARELLERLDQIHDMVTRSVPNARPPRFGYDWTDEDTLVMEYRSQRGLVDLFVCLLKGVGDYFDERLAVSRTGNRVTVRFPALVAAA